MLGLAGPVAPVAVRSTRRERPAGQEGGQAAGDGIVEEVFDPHQPGRMPVEGAATSRECLVVEVPGLDPARQGVPVEQVAHPGSSAEENGPLRAIGRL